MKVKRILDRLAGCYYLFVRDRKNVVWVDKGIIKRTRPPANPHRIRHHCSTSWIWQLIGYQTYHLGIGIYTSVSVYRRPRIQVCYAIKA
jgi:hypothetical protein